MLGSQGEIGGEARAYVRVVSCLVKGSSGVQASIEGLDGCESMEAKDAKDVEGIDCAIEPKDSERFISGGERSEETGICCGSSLWCELFAIAGSVWRLRVNGDVKGLERLQAGGRVYKCG